MERRRALSWNTEVYTHPDDIDNLEKVITLLKEKGIPFTITKDPRPRTSAQALYINYKGQEFYICSNVDSYLILHKRWFPKSTTSIPSGVLNSLEEIWETGEQY